MTTTYPPASPTISGDVQTINTFLQSPTRVARVLRSILLMRYIADTLLKGRFNVVGGAVQYETGETIFTADDPRAVAPGGEYPLTTVGTGTSSIAKTVKWGQDALITDEAIKRLGFDPVRRALLKLANQNVRHIDSVALSAIASAVTGTQAAASTWPTATATQILTDVLTAEAAIVNQNQGYNPDVVVVDPVSHAHALAKFAAAGYFSRENNGANPALTGEFPVIAGKLWLSTPNVPVAGRALLVDSDQLGGMADEDLGGPGYAPAADPGTAPVEVKTMRDDEDDQWRVRARRVTVPVVIEPAAGRWITGIA